MRFRKRLLAVTLLGVTLEKSQLIALFDLKSNSTRQQPEKLSTYH
jgi:hypothetical protein